ncbi:MAG: DNA cytosine methyltransferase [Wenzhouxiangella sp.]
MKIVDLFCGAGGFALGAHGAGFDVALSVDSDKDLTASYQSNFPGGNLLKADVTHLTGSVLLSKVAGHIDGLIGGPPCQGFSLIGKRDKRDPRRLLIQHFFRLVAEIRPTFFVMENVPGLIQGSALSVLEDGLARVPGAYDIIGPFILNAADCGVATSRRRCFVVGVMPAYCDRPDLTGGHSTQTFTVRDAIYDLAFAKDSGLDDEGFDVFRLPRMSHVSPYAASLRATDLRSTGNRRTRHSEEVVRRFEKVIPGKVDPVGRHQRLSWDGQCPTLRAGTGSDRGSYQSVRPLHPDEPRVITVREAARLQGFPDGHRFHPTIWHSFRMIGNSVPPPVAKFVMLSIARAVSDRHITHVAAK